MPRIVVQLPNTFYPLELERKPNRVTPLPVFRNIRTQRLYCYDRVENEWYYVDYKRALLKSE